MQQKANKAQILDNNLDTILLQAKKTLRGFIIPVYSKIYKYMQTALILLLKNKPTKHHSKRKLQIL